MKNEKVFETFKEAEDYVTVDFERNVPSSGICKTMHGEFNRAVSKIYYRNWNDGDKIGVEYGNETCNAPARFLLENLDKNQPYAKELTEIICAMWGEYSDTVYETLLNKLVITFANFQRTNEEANKAIPAVDMLSYNRPEDTDYFYEDDEDEEYYEEEYDEYDEEIC